MKNLEQFIAQTKASIKAIDEAVLGLQAKVESRRTEQVELAKILKKLEAPDVAVPEEPMLP